MIWSLFALVLGFAVDLVFGDPHRIPHPVVLIGKWISILESALRKWFPKNPAGEKTAGGMLWLIVVITAYLVPFFLLYFCHRISPWARLLVETLMCWQILATKSLRDESMKVYRALRLGSLEQARAAVSMIVGRDTDQLDEAAITRATVETIAENTSDGIIAPMLFITIGGAPLGFFYKAVNTMDSMLGYVEPPYRNIGYIPAKMDDVMNYIPARFSALIMLIAGVFLQLDTSNGWKIFVRDRYNHASPNSAQTESVCAGLLRIRLAGDASYHGVLHKKKFIGDDLRPITIQDITLSCHLLYATAILGLLLCTFGKLLFWGAF